MGYYATGSGEITFEEKLDKDIIKEIKRIADSDFDIDAYETKLSPGTIMDLDTDGKYHGEDIQDILNEIANTTKIKTGEICFHGEDDSHWRFLWTGKDWIEQNGEIVYEPLQREFGHVKWSEQDVWNYLDEHPEFPEDDEFCENVLKRCMDDTHFTDQMVEAGWLSIAEHAYNELQEYNEKHN